MRSTKFIDLLQTLTDREFRHFLAFYRKHHTGRKTEIALLEYLAAYHPADYRNAALTKPVLFTHLYGDVPFNNKRLGNIFSDCHLRLREFLIQQRLEREPLLQHLLLIDEFRQRRMADAYFENIEAGLKAAAAIPGQGQHTALARLVLLHAAYYSSLDNKLSTREHKAEKLRELLSQLEYVYLTCRNKYLAERHNRKRILREPTDADPPPGAPPARKSDPFKELYAPFAAPLHPSLEARDQLFFVMKARFLEQLDRLAKEDQSVLLSYLCNLAATLMRQGRAGQYVSGLLELNKVALERGLFLEFDNFTPTRFLNIVELALHEGDLRWLKGFIRDYRGELPASRQQAVYDMARAFLSFGEGDYPGALERLNRIRLHDLSMNIRRRYLTAQIFFHLQEYETLSSFLDSFENFLRRQTGYGPEHFEAYYNFIKMLRLFLQRRHSAADLTEKMEELRPLACTLWLSRQIGRAG